MSTIPGTFTRRMPSSFITHTAVGLNNFSLLSSVWVCASLKISVAGAVGSSCATELNAIFRNLKCLNQKQLPHLEAVTIGEISVTCCLSDNPSLFTAMFMWKEPKFTFPLLDSDSLLASHEVGLVLVQDQK